MCAFRSPAHKVKACKTNPWSSLMVFNCRFYTLAFNINLPFLQRTETKTDEEKKTEEQQQEAIKKVVQETLIVKEKHVMSLHASEDAAKLAGLQLDATAQTISHVASSIKGKEGSAITEGAKEEKAATQQEETATISHDLQEEQSKSAHILNTQESKPLFEVIKHV